MRRNIFVFLLSICALLPSCKAPIALSGDFLGLTKQEVVNRLGFPTKASIISGKAKGSPGIEFWTYYQSSSSGEIETKQVVFGNSIKSLGRVVTYDPNILSNRIISAETSEGLSAIFKYNSAHGQ